MGCTDEPVIVVIDKKSYLQTKKLACTCAANEFIAALKTLGVSAWLLK